MIKSVNHIADMAPYVLAELGDAGAISLAQNESAYPVTPKALDVMLMAGADAQLYPDPDWKTLRQSIAAVHRIPAETILCGAGSMELIGCLIRAFAGPGDAVVGTAHGYLFVATATQQAGARYIMAAETDLTVSVEHLLDCVTAETKILFVCNPGNPTGTRILNSEIVRLRQALAANVLLVIDQAYGEYDDQDHSCIFDLVARGDTVILRTFSKAYGLASARVGWGYFPDYIADETRKLLNPNNISGVSQAMAVSAMDDQGYMRKTVRQTARLRDQFADRLRRAGLAVPVSHTNFVLIGFPDAAQAGAADQRLQQAGYILRGMAGYGLADCLRATIGAAQDMDAVADILIRFQENSHGS